jgi:flagellar biosynthesis protein FlhF
LGQYEVVFGVTNGEQGGQASATQPAASSSSPWSADLTELRSQVEKLQQMLSRPPGQTLPEDLPTAQPHSEMELLIEAGLESGLAREIASTIPQQARGATNAGRMPVAPPRREILPLLHAEVDKRFQVAPSVGAVAAGRRIAAFVGPPGVGKSTTLAKVAIRNGLAVGIDVHIISVLGRRLGSQEPLRSYATILGLSHEELPSATLLRAALDRCQDEDLVLIDTPGYGPKEMREAAELAAVLTSDPNIDTHLVLRAPTAPSDVRLTVNRYKQFGFAKVIFTFVDEVDSLGPLVSEAVRLGKPLSYLGTGQRVPHDLQDASKQLITNRLLALDRNTELSAA